MKNLTKKEFAIEKTTMRDLTPNELDKIGGASHCPTIYHQGVPLTVGETVETIA